MILYNVYNDIENRYEWDMSHDIFNGNQWDIQQSKIKKVHPKWEYVARADDQPLEDICMKIQKKNDGQFIRIRISQTFGFFLDPPFGLYITANGTISWSHI